MKYLYKYPQAAYPYANLVDTSRARSRNEFEYELLDTGVFDQNRYFDVFVEYAKESPDDILIQISIHNRGPEAAELHVLPTLWFRNQWSWTGAAGRLTLQRVGNAVKAVHPTLGERYLYCDGDATLLFTENETNTQRIFGVPNRNPYVKDSINNYVVHGQHDAVNPALTGTKASPHYVLSVGPRESRTVRLRLTERDFDRENPFGKAFDALLAQRRSEADEFYASITPPSLGPDAANVLRQALAGMLWSKQFYHYDVDKWLASHVQRRHHFHAGQVGVSLVRRLGPGLPRARPDTRGRRFRQAAIEADAARALHAPQRPDPGLRVELRGRQPAGPRLGHLFHLPPGDGAERRGG
jgi:hypothetical protein